MLNRFFEYLKKCDHTVSLTLGEIKLHKILGQGGNGVVYSGEFLSNTIALKFLITDATGSKLESKNKRFLAEYFNIVTVENTLGIVRYIDFDILKFNDSEGDANIPVILMKEYKTSLKNASPIKDVGTFFDIFDFLINTVEKIHGCGIIHRDIKPENILIDQFGYYVLADFGIASYNPDIFSIRAKTEKKERVGNRLFSAPEQEMPGKVAHPTMDIYAIGQVLHWLVFTETHRGTNRKRIATEFPDLDKYDEIIERCLSNDYRKRYQSISELKGHLNSMRSPEKDVWQYIHTFGDILVENFPKNEFGIIYSNNIKRIDKLFHSLKNHEEEFESHLWWHSGIGNNQFYLKQISEGKWRLNSKEICIEEIWIHYDLSLYNDFIMVHFKKGEPFIVNGKEQYYNIFVDDIHEITFGEYENRRAEIQDDIINLSEHKVEFVEREKEDGYLIISTRYHCALRTDNDRTVREFIEKLKLNKGEIAIDEFLGFASKLRVHIHNEVAMGI